MSSHYEDSGECARLREWEYYRDMEHEYYRDMEQAYYRDMEQEYYRDMEQGYLRQGDAAADSEINEQAINNEEEK